MNRPDTEMIDKIYHSCKEITGKLDRLWWLGYSSSSGCVRSKNTDDGITNSNFWNDIMQAASETLKENNYVSS